VAAHAGSGRTRGEHVLGMTASEVDDLLNHRSGLQGLCGRSDMREVEQRAEAGEEGARLAVEAFAYRVRKYLGAYAAGVGGLDAIAFTGGIGEHAPATRVRICRGLEFLGVRIEPDLNRRAIDGEGPARVSPDGTPVQVWVVPTDEEGEIARQLYQVLE
jgi:acetate kinase